MANPGGNQNRFAECLAEAQRLGPMKPADLAEYNSQRAREMAKAEARRDPSPQLELNQAA